ncbi:hypothetical protein ACPYO6_13395 [Georgenia sp. Z1344]|uniref:hypothetical protein n=1 Tax=Georgenia sp. Z1344 TaxID=3416706 RepID=UPI003CEAE350
MRYSTTRQTLAATAAAALALSLAACSDDDVDTTEPAPPATSEPAPEPTEEPTTEEAPSDETPSEDPTTEEPPAEETPSDDAPTEESPSEDQGDDEGDGSGDAGSAHPTDVPGSVELFGAIATVQDAHPDAQVVAVSHNDTSEYPEEPEGNGTVVEAVSGDQLLTITLDPSGAVVDETSTPADSEILGHLDVAALTIDDAIELALAETSLGGGEFILHSVSLTAVWEGDAAWNFLFYGPHDFSVVYDAVTGENVSPVG